MEGGSLPVMHTASGARSDIWMIYWQYTSTRCGIVSLSAIAPFSLPLLLLLTYTHLCQSNLHHHVPPCVHIGQQTNSHPIVPYQKIHNYNKYYPVGLLLY